MRLPADGANANARFMRLAESPNEKRSQGLPELEGCTGLMLAAGEGHIEVVKVLLAHDADVNARDQLGTTALMKAMGRFTIANLLLNHGAEVNAQSTDGRTA